MTVLFAGWEAPSFLEPQTEAMPWVPCHLDQIPWIQGSVALVTIGTVPKCFGGMHIDTEKKEFQPGLDYLIRGGQTQQGENKKVTYLKTNKHLRTSQKGKEVTNYQPNVAFQLLQGSSKQKLFKL